MNRQLQVYTDGASGNRTGKDGGAASIIVHGSDEYEIQSGWTNTSNNRMELRSVIQALDAITNTLYHVTVYSDSQYVTKAFTELWVYEWERNNFDDKKNEDLWRMLLMQVRRFKNVKFVWVKGHNGHKYNERCDKLAGQAAKWPPERKKACIL